jgi:hypothetical protein
VAVFDTFTKRLGVAATIEDGGKAILGQVNLYEVCYNNGGLR